jgi:tetratricopeptide (TPR) repeat protein
MKTRIAFILTFFWCLGVQAAGTEDRVFDQANLYYQQGEYQKALEGYHQIEASGMVSASLYYNLGNSYYKLGEIGKAILFYERALRLDPGDEDIRSNLVMANQATLDKIVSPPQFALARWLRRILYLFSFSNLLTACIAIYYVLAGLWIARILRPTERVRKLVLRGVLVLSLPFVLLVATATAQWVDSHIHVEGVVQVSELHVLSSPDEGSSEVFVIHEGTKVRIDEGAGEWFQIVLLDGKVGWVRSENIAVI